MDRVALRLDVVRVLRLLEGGELPLAVVLESLDRLEAKLQGETSAAVLGHLTSVLALTDWTPDSVFAPQRPDFARGFHLIEQLGRTRRRSRLGLLLDRMMVNPEAQR